MDRAHLADHATQVLLRALLKQLEVCSEEQCDPATVAFGAIRAQTAQTSPSTYEQTVTPSYSTNCWCSSFWICERSPTPSTDAPTLCCATLVLRQLSSNLIIHNGCQCQSIDVDVRHVASPDEMTKARFAHNLGPYQRDLRVLKVWQKTTNYPAVSLHCGVLSLRL